ncbi:MAG: YggS family pyridoxal phosphate-dependent enzyme [Ignavibacteriales bacterium]|nr:YggS family pyridoxal phosphate-dependent enzyme [Ignavibacteriales bacterium]
MIKDNIKILLDKIELRCKSSGRNFDDLTLVAVSKNQPIEKLYEAYNSNLIHFGENKAQEFKQKVGLCKEPVHWHFIGHLQTNKVKYVIDSAELIHSVESIKIADEINNKANSINKKQKILLQINTSLEESKFGIASEEDIFKLYEYCYKLKNISVEGLMTMAPFTEDEKIIRDSFKGLRIFKEKIEKHYSTKLKELSMGMTNDFLIAIDEGSTILRIGTAIFGERN